MAVGQYLPGAAQLYCPDPGGTDETHLAEGEHHGKISFKYDKEDVLLMELPKYSDATGSISGKQRSYDELRQRAKEQEKQTERLCDVNANLPIEHREELPEIVDIRKGQQLLEKVRKKDYQDTSEAFESRYWYKIDFVTPDEISDFYTVYGEIGSPHDYIRVQTGVKSGQDASGPQSISSPEGTSSVKVASSPEGTSRQLDAGQLMALLAKNIRETEDTSRAGGNRRKDTSVCYSNYFNIKEKIILVHKNFRNIDKSLCKSSQDLEKVLQNSEILWHQLRLATRYWAEHHKDQPTPDLGITKVVGYYIINDKTMPVAERYGTVNEAKPYLKGSDAYYAHLQTPIVTPIVYLLEQHKHVLGGREIAELEVELGRSFAKNEIKYFVAYIKESNIFPPQNPS
jgi:hypothetical protein